MKSLTAIFLTLFVILLDASDQGEISSAPKVPSDETHEAVGWPVTEGAPGGGRYSPLTDINRGNVAQLEIAWTYRHGDFKSGGILPD